MSDDIEVGDWVKITAKVVKTLPEQVKVELFSKTDQYEGWVRLDVCERTTAPIPPEPDHDAIIRDKDGDYWRYSAPYGGWGCITDSSSEYTWEKLWNSFGPLKVYEQVS
jgi:hypothetical protein